MDDLFQSTEACKQFVGVVVDDECRRATEQLSGFQRKLILLSDHGNLFEIRVRLAEECGLHDGGAEELKQLRQYLRSARRRKGPCPLHPSGLTVTALLQTVEGQLDPRVDYLWLVLRDSRSSEPGKGQKALVIALVALFFLGLFSWLLWKAFMLGGPILALAFVVLLFCAWMIDLHNRRKHKGKT